jgi:hypothetical protein
MKIIYDIDNDRVVSEDGSRLVFHTLPLSCPDEVVCKVVGLFNTLQEQLPNWTINYVDSYLLDEYRCTQEDREYIVESIHRFLYSQNNN